LGSMSYYHSLWNALDRSSKKAIGSVLYESKIQFGLIRILVEFLAC